MSQPLISTPIPSSTLGPFDLMIRREVPITANECWRGWTTPDLIRQWFVPRPWSIAACTFDLRAGGLCHTVMRSPEGQEFPNSGCFLELIPDRRVVFTDALGADFRPTGSGFFTGIITFEPAASGCIYTARALHKDAADRQKHADMGFEPGWNLCLDQLVELMLSLRTR